MQMDADPYRLQIIYAFYLSISYNYRSNLQVNIQYLIVYRLSKFDLVENIRNTTTGYLLNDFTFRNNVVPMTSTKRKNFNHLGYMNKCTTQPTPKRDT